MRRIVCIIAVSALVLNLAGCTALQKKFTPKKKKQVKMPRVYQFKEYKKKPTPELYQKHYAYWMTWQSELIKVLGENGKKDKRCIQEIVGNLRDMQSMLVEEKADIFDGHIERLESVKSEIFGNNVTQANKDYTRRVLEKEDRSIKREFCLRKMRNYLKKSFNEEPPAEQAPQEIAVKDPGPEPTSVVFMKTDDAPSN